MTEWTREKRYSVLKSADELRELYDRVSGCKYRQRFHVQPITGLLNDPNGFMRTNDGWHLFYQWCPWGAVHGLKYWYHVFSKDLVHWKNIGVALKPDTLYDNKGVYSGCALVDGSRKFLFYTGNHRTAEWKRIPYTCLAEIKDDAIEKFPEPLFTPSQDYTEHQRDPKVVFDASSDCYYLLLGAQTKQLKGRIIVYKSVCPDRHWQFAGELEIPGYEDFGDMWECPSIERIGGTDVLIFCPQHIELQDRGKAVNHCGYILGNMDYNALRFTPYSDFRVLDEGFDFYAAACAANTGDGSCILSAWMGLPDADYPSDEHEWQGCLTVPRELSVAEGRLLQRPVNAVKNLRKRQITDEKAFASPCDMELSVYGSFDMGLFSKSDGTGGLRLSYNAQTRKVYIGRAALEKRFSVSVGEDREATLFNELTSARILVDKSSVEVFLNDGECAMTARVFPGANETELFLTGDARLKAWELSECVDNSFII